MLSPRIPNSSYPSFSQFQVILYKGWKGCITNYIFCELIELNFSRGNEMMENKEQHHTTLTSAEIASLWTSYQEDTLTICGISYFLNHVDDAQIRGLLEQGLTSAEQRKEKEIQFFNKENYPLPQGFTDHDVNVEAPRLFSDKLHLEYLVNITSMNLIVYGTALPLAERSDIITFYSENLTETKKLYKQAKELAKEKGVNIRAPHIPKPNQVEFVQKESFLAGWFGERRPLLGMEISNLVSSARRNALGQAVITGFSQVANTREVRQFFEKGRDISGKHLEVFSDILQENYLSSGAQLMTSEVTDSTVAPFSDRLMMNFITTLIASGIGQYGYSLATSPRHDLAAQYAKLMTEIGKYSNDGANILIENGWMEQPPMAADRKDLAKR